MLLNAPLHMATNLFGGLLGLAECRLEVPAKDRLGLGGMPTDSCLSDANFRNPWLASSPLIKERLGVSVRTGQRKLGH